MSWVRSASTYAHAQVLVSCECDQVSGVYLSDCFLFLSRTSGFTGTVLFCRSRFGVSSRRVLTAVCESQLFLGLGLVSTNAMRTRGRCDLRITCHVRLLIVQPQCTSFAAVTLDSGQVFPYRPSHRFLRVLPSGSPALVASLATSAGRVQAVTSDTNLHWRARRCTLRS
jgi:hypothetical protein